MRGFRTRAVIVGVALTLMPTAAVTLPPAYADTLGYIVNVTIRPGYTFPNAEVAVAYGNGICDKVEHGRPFGSIVSDIKADFETSDEYQASYLISQAVGELCPSQIWQLRQSAAGYRAREAP